MKKLTVYYVRFLAPGSFVANDWIKEVAVPDPKKVEWPDNAYAFTLHKRIDVVDGVARFKGAPEQIGPTYYHPDSRVASLAEIKAAANPHDSILISNMECNGWDRVIYSRWGNWPQPYDPNTCEVL